MSSVHDRLVAQLTRIKELSGLSLRALARQTGLSSSSLSRYLSGQLVPPWDAVVALCRVVGRDPRPLRALWVEASKAGAEPAPRRNDLPADLADFTGRESEAAQVTQLLQSAGAVAIDGMAGVGKTSLAVHVAHRLAPSFPDGGLYLDLRGFTPGQAPLEPSAALARLLSAVGVSQPPVDTTDRAALWRSELSRRRALVVLDNAVDAEHVRPLLPGAGKSAVLVTSRNRLVDLAELPPVSLEPLSNDDAASLFGRASGVDAPDEDAVTQVLRQCAGLRWHCEWRVRGFDTVPVGRSPCWPSGCATAPADSIPCSACRCTSWTPSSAAFFACWASCQGPTSTRRWSARSPT